MLKQRYGLGLAVAVMSAAVLACQPLVPGSTPGGGELTMQVAWPMRIQAIPPTTAVVAVGVFRDGSLISKGSFRVGIVGRGAGTIFYSGLANGEYRVVAGAYDKDARPLAGGVGLGTINIQAGPRTRVALSLQPGDPAAELNPFIPDIQRYLAGMPKELDPTPTPTPTVLPPTPPTGDPNNVNSPPPPDTPATDSPPTSATPTPAATPTTGAGTTAGGGGSSSSSTSNVTFSGGFQ